MERYLGLDVHAASSTLAVISESGRRLQTHVVETNGRDLVRVQARLKSVYRSRGIGTPGRAVYGKRHREPWQQQLPATARTTATPFYEQIDFLVALKEQAEQDLIRESRKHSIARVLETTPGLGPIRVARLLPIVVTPHRFRTRQQFWSYCGLGIVMRSSSDWVRTPDERWIRAQVRQTRGLTRPHNHALKDLFKGAATTIITQALDDPLCHDYERVTEAGTKPNLAKLTLARKIASTVLALWKKEEPYRPKHRIASETDRGA
ncbi:MAG: IS110 family transposase [Myxococcales bacterium]|nr:IS110 family transposase [Myxococcales bacterium]